MCSDKGRDLDSGFSVGNLPLGGLLSESFDLSDQAKQHIHLEVCAVFQSEHSVDDTLMFKLLDMGIAIPCMIE